MAKKKKKNSGKSTLGALPNRLIYTGNLAKPI